MTCNLIRREPYSAVYLRSVLLYLNFSKNKMFPILSFLEASKALKLKVISTTIFELELELCYYIYIYFNLQSGYIFKSSG